MHQPSVPRSRRSGAVVRFAVTALLAGALAATGAPPASAAPAASSDAVASASTVAPSTHQSWNTARKWNGARQWNAGRKWNASRCVPIRLESDYYEGGVIVSEQTRTPRSRCTSISVSDIRDPANPTDRCQTFYVGFWPLVNNSLTFTEPVVACGRHRTVLARNVPNNARYVVIYAIEYLEPTTQTVKFRVWH